MWTPDDPTTPAATTPAASTSMWNNPAWNTAASGALGGAAGAVPQTGTTSTSGNFQNTGTTASTGNFDMNSFMNFLNAMQSLVTSSQQASTTGTSATSTTPTLTPEEQALMSKLVGQAGSLSTPSLTGYAANQTSNINANAQAQEQAVNNIMASRGLATSPAAATAQAQVEQNRLNQITGMQQQLPLLQNQLNLQNLAGVTSAFGMMPKGVSTVGTTGQTSQATGSQGTTQQTTGSQTGGQTGVQTQTGQTSNQGTSAQNQTTSQGGGLPGLLSGVAKGLATVLPFLSDKKLKEGIGDVSQDEAVEKLRKLKGKTWTWKGMNQQGSGVVAQDVQKVLPHLVHDLGYQDDSGKEQSVKMVNYHGLVPYLIGAIQHLDRRVSEAGSKENAREHKTAKAVA